MNLKEMNQRRRNVTAPFGGHGEQEQEEDGTLK